MNLDIPRNIFDPFVLLFGFLVVGCGPFSGKTEAAADKGTGATANESRYSIAILDHNAESVQNALSDVFTGLESLSLDKLIAGSTDYDCLILPSAPRLPAIAFDAVHRYMQAGGDVVFLDGKPWADPTYKVGGDWLGRDQVVKALQDVAFTPLGGDEELDRYRRVAFTEATDSVIKVNKGSQGQGVMMVLDARDWYDYYVRDLRPGEVPEGASMLSFMVKGHCYGRGAYLEVTERDGSVWWRKIQVAKQWSRVVSMAADFQYLKGNDARQGSSVNLAEIQSIGLGQNFKQAGMKDDKYWIWLDELAMSNALRAEDFPAGDLAADFTIRALYPFADYDIYEMDGVRRVRRFAKSPFTAPIDFATEYSAISAVGIPAVEDGFFIPVLTAYDAYEDELGWAGGIVVNTAGEYAGSNWAFFNFPQEAVAEGTAFARLLAEITSSFADESVSGMKPAFPRSETIPRKPRTIDFVKPSADGKTIVDAQGEDFFLIGTNYIYPMNSQSFKFWKTGISTAEGLARIEDDFRKMQAAGINTVRVFNQEPMNSDPAVNAKFKELCQTYGIQMLMQIVTHSYDETDREVMDRLERVVSAFADDPSVFAFDIQNEPQIGEIGGVRIGGEPSALLQIGLAERYAEQYDRNFVDKLVKAHHKGKGGYPKMAPWLEDKDEVRDLYAADNLWRRAIDNVYSPKGPSVLEKYPSSLEALDPSLAPFIKALNATYEAWYAPQAKRIREMAPNQLLTVGYNRGYVALPFNEDLDFLSQHSYFRAKTDKEVMLYTRIQDKLREIWPETPVTIGEYGYSSGLAYDSEFISNDSAAAAEFLMYLYSYAQGYSGVMKWRLNDDEISASFKDYHWLQNMPMPRRMYESRFGMYAFDGYQSIPKPIVHCLSFFRDYVDSYATDRGTIETASNTQVPHTNTQYVYRAQNALFIGNVESDEGMLEFKTPDGNVANVMAMWNDEDIRLMSTKTMEVTVHSPTLAKAHASGSLLVEGRHGPIESNGKQLKLVLIRGEAVQIQRPDGTDSSTLR